MKKRIHQIELFIKYPVEVQNELLKKLIHSAKDTEWGRTFDFKSIKNSGDYKQRFPIQDYESLRPFIFRVKEGEQNVLWSSDIKWFAKSSGTTSDKSKFIPVSEEALEECHYKGGKDMLSIYCNNFPETKIFSGKSLAMGGSHNINKLSNDSYYGDLSAILMQNLPFWAEFVRTPDLSIALMDKWEIKIRKMAEAAMQEDVTNISGVPSWTLVLIKYIMDLTGKKSLMEVWPNLELFIHGGVSFAPYREQFKQFIPATSMHYMETYNASEGFFGIQDDPSKDDLLLMLDYGIYYEFLDMNDLDSNNPKTYSLEEVKTGVNYALIISTNAGLWRYMIGDTVRFTSVSPFRIKISGRTKHFINAFGEELIIENAEHAIKDACSKTGAIVSEYTAAPVYMNKTETGAHEWVIEFSRPPKSMDSFCTELDISLKSVNSDYEAKRHLNMALKAPIIRDVPQGTFNDWLRSKNKLGGQNKVPRLSNERKYVEEILSMLHQSTH